MMNEKKRKKIKPQINMVDLIQSLVFVYITCICLIKRCAPFLDEKRKEEKKKKRELIHKGKRLLYHCNK